MPEPGANLPEPLRNSLLRRVDWRFLLSQSRRPRTLDLSSGRDSRAVALIAEPVGRDGSGADLAATGFPRPEAVGAAVRALRPGGEIVCLWRLPLPWRVRRARARLEDAGFGDVRLYFAGPLPHRAPQFWLPLESSVATAHLLAQRPLRSRFQALLRALWGPLRRLGLVTPLCAIGRLPGGDGEGAEGGADPVLLLTGGGRSLNKVVALPFPAGAAEPAEVVKFARTPEADAALDREAAALRTLAEEHPGVPGVPRLLARERRAGRRALAESAVRGQPLIATLTPRTFPLLARDVTGWLAGLVEDGEPRPASEWFQRLVDEPLDAIERDFGAVVEAATFTRLRARLRDLGPLPRACEHRDCSPWNVVVGEDGSPGLLDWESAEPHGLPGLDLAYFLANSAFVLDGAIETGRTRESYRRLLDPATPFGSEAASRVTEYCDRVGLGPAAFARLRTLAWVVHAHSDHLHREMAAAGPPSAEALRTAPYLGLVEAELERSSDVELKD
jgi:hypothetical protein